jgi:transposase
MAKRRRFSAEFKARVALEAIRGENSLAELASKHGIHPNLITNWKRQAVEGMASVFDGKTTERDQGRDAEMKDLTPRSASW